MDTGRCMDRYSTTLAQHEAGPLFGKIRHSVMQQCNPACRKNMWSFYTKPIFTRLLLHIAIG